MTPLNEREMAVLRLTAQGATTNQMARALKLSPNTVEKASTSLRTKLGAVNAANAVDVAHRAGLFDDATTLYLAERRDALAAELQAVPA